MHCELEPSWSLPVHRKASLVSLFAWYVRGMLRREFFAVHLHAESVPRSRGADAPRIVFLNHASWWDPLVMLHLSRSLFPEASAYAPMEADQLRRYAFFRRLGLFAVRSGAVSAGRDFLRASRMVLEREQDMLWITPESRFVDARERPVRFAPGLAHLAVRYPDVRFVPLAVEYAFGTEKRPEVFLRFGQSACGRDWGQTPAQAQEGMERALESTQDLLAADVISRRLEGFERMVSGRAGASLPYDLWRRMRAAFRGRDAVLRHSTEHGAWRT